MPEWKLNGAGTSYMVTGAPVVAQDLTHALAGSTLRLLLIGVLVMALVLALVFRAPAAAGAARRRAGGGGDLRSGSSRWSARR